MPDPVSVIDLEAPAALLTLYVGIRANQLGIQPDAALADPRWATLCTEAMQLFNSWMVWDANLAIPAYAAAFGPSAKKPAPTSAPSAPPTPAAPTTPATPSTLAPTSAPSATPVVNPVAAAMAALGLKPAS